MAVGVKIIIAVVEAVNPHRQIAAGHNFGIQLADSAGGGIARIGVKRFAVAFPFVVHFMKDVQRQVHLAPHFQPFRYVTGQPMRYVGDPAQVSRNILSDPTVAARCPQRQMPVDIDQADGQAVDFQFGYHTEGPPIQQVFNALMPRLQVVAAESVAQAEHGDGMLHLRKAVGGAAADALSRRIGGATFRVG